MKRHPWFLAGILLSATGAFAALPNDLPILPSVIREVATGRPADTKNEQATVASLKEKSLSDNWDTALPALRELKGMGNIGRPALIEVLKTQLTRNQDAISAAVAGIGDGKEAAEFETRIEALRAQARANIPNLDKSKPETIKKAHEFYDQLVPMTTRMNQAWSLRLAIVEGLDHRAPLITMWREVASSKDTTFPASSETKLKQSARAAVGDFLDRAAGLKYDRPPHDESVKPLWFFGVARRIEAWNKPILEKYMDQNEAQNFNMVNAYREAIGLMPYEADPRLIQAARRHSKEMVDLKYFSHESPTASEKDFGTRSKNAGYHGGSGENIAYGAGDGAGTFWMWFDSPGHHKNMAGGSNALGVGRWNSHYTQNFGAGPRIMQMPEAEKAKIKIEGKVLEPQSTTALPPTATRKKKP